MTSLAELLDTLLVATGAEVALLATEGEEVVVPAVVAVQSGEAAGEVAAGGEVVQGVAHLGAQAALRRFEADGVLVLKCRPVVMQALPERGCAWAPGAVK